MTGRRNRRFSSQNLLATSYTGESMSTLCYLKFRRDVTTSGPWGSDKLEVLWRKGLWAWVKL